jgi:hypothetical protein
MEGLSRGDVERGTACSEEVFVVREVLHPFGAEREEILFGPLQIQLAQQGAQP